MVHADSFHSVLQIYEVMIGIGYQVFITTQWSINSWRRVAGLDIRYTADMPLPSLAEQLM